MQIHGEVNLKRHVQRLVAASKYREVPKTQRSYALRVTGPAVVAGKYERQGAHGDMPLYVGDGGKKIFFDGGKWRMAVSEENCPFMATVAWRRAVLLVTMCDWYSLDWLTLRRYQASRSRRAAVGRRLKSTGAICPCTSLPPRLALHALKGNGRGGERGQASGGLLPGPFHAPGRTGVPHVSLA